ncbi:MAG TPA: MauE/DoxX family redox-associated membrane protein [Bryobacteraceae bacterium]|jgi:uncharacterized membrane protein YphA (DoxX/SURF4 family)/thiol-disulfide isomerase/thioredoxin|nr:MauE/DoxX family redox-associated membrane protein [Bryobacteraceae bacterium]
MDDSMAHSGDMLARFELPSWKSWLNWTGALLTSALFLSAGLWKITDAPGMAVRLGQLKVPQELTLPAAVLLGIVETFAAVLVLVPRFRRWGAWLAGLMLVVFMVYVGVNYNALHGADCSCFPWLKRAVGPGFFIGDGIMLALAALAGIWSKRSDNLRGAALVLGAVVVFALVSYGVAATHNSGLKAPDTVLVDGKPYSLQEGRVFIYFFNPECTHCLEAARKLAKLNWGATRVVGVATEQPQFALGFMQITGLKGAVSTDIAILRKTFPFVDPPAGVALENGRQKAALAQFEGEEPAATLKKLGFVN